MATADKFQRVEYTITLTLSQVEAEWLAGQLYTKASGTEYNENIRGALLLALGTTDALLMEKGWSYECK
jgi:hypothetical protein